MIRRLICAALATFALTPAAANAASELRFYNWADYFDPAVIEAFEAETGVTVILETYTESDIAEANLLPGGSGHDLAVTPGLSLARLREAGAMLPLDQSRIESAGALDPAVTELMTGMDGKARTYATPYLYGQVGLAVNEAAVRARIPDAPLDSLALIFDPEHAARLADCGIAVIDSVEEVVAAALAYLGRDPRSSNPQDLEAAFAAIEVLAAYATSFDSSHYDALIKREICVALTWNTEGVGAEFELENSPFKFIAPKEGATVWVDVFIIPEGAQNLDAAYQFLNFLYRPETMALLAEWSYAAGPIPDAREHMWEPLQGHDGVFSDLSAPGLHALAARTSASKAELDRRWRRAILGF